MTISPAASEIAAIIAPKLQSYTVAHKEEIVQSAGNRLERVAVRGAFSWLVRQILYATGFVAHLFLSHFGGLTLGQISTYLVRHAEATGGEVHPSVSAAAQR